MELENTPSLTKELIMFLKNNLEALKCTQTYYIDRIRAYANTEIPEIKEENSAKFMVLGRLEENEYPKVTLLQLDKNDEKIAGIQLMMSEHLDLIKRLNQLKKHVNLYDIAIKRKLDDKFF